jgi:hypothetical protein
VGHADPDQLCDNVERLVSGDVLTGTEVRRLVEAVVYANIRGSAAPRIWRIVATPCWTPM